MTKKFSILFALMLIALVGCKQDPFPTDGRILQKPPPKPTPIPPPFVLEFPESFNFVEGETGKFGIRASVPKPGKPQVTVQNLPPGATFDPEKLEVTWEPDYDAANDPNDPRVTIRTYTLRFVLRSDEDPLTSISRKAVLVVRDAPRSFSLELPSGTDFLKETETYSKSFKIKSEDFPQGPFKIQAENLPQSAVLTPDPDDPTQFKIEYTPGLRTVTIADRFTSSLGHYKLRNVDLTAISPSGAAVKGSLQWQIRDSRAYAQVSAPDELTQNNEVNLVLVAEDVNGETRSVQGLTHPKVEVETPEFGVFKMDLEYNDPEADGGGNPTTLASVRWTQIPASKIGTDYDLTFNVCVNRSRWYKDHCKPHTVKIHFEGNSHPAPTIDRSKWALGTIQYVRERESLEVPLTITEEGGVIPTVEIFPESARATVKWVAGTETAPSKLVIEGASAGVKQFNVVATSGFGVVQMESFLYEVLPWSWSKVLVLGESPTQKEVSETLDLFDDASIVNPLLQQLDSRTLALRTTLVAGTSMLGLRGLLAKVEEAAVNLKNVVLMTPLIDNLAGPLDEELRDLEVSVKGRFSDLSLPELKKFDVRPDAAMTNLNQPTNPVPLNQSLTAESKNPAILSLGNNSNCKPALNLESADHSEALLVAVVCTRTNGGVLLVSGIEWGDLGPIVPDTNIAEKWMSELVKP